MEFLNILRDIKHKWGGQWWLVPSNFGELDRTCVIERPSSIADPSLVFLQKNTKLRGFAKIVNSPGYKFVMKKYSVASLGLTVVTGNHKQIVGLPHFFSGSNHIHDVESDIVIEEAAWLGVNVTLLYGARIGRGAVVGAGAVVNKPIPPYAVAVGMPAKVVASVFTIEQILCHESLIYPPEERFTRAQLEQLFDENFQGKKSIGIEVELTSDEVATLSKYSEKYGSSLIGSDYGEVMSNAIANMHMNMQQAE